MRSALAGALLLTLAAMPVFAAPPVSGQIPADFLRAVSELDRAPDTIVAEVGSRTVVWGDVADALRSMPPAVTLQPLQTVALFAVAAVLREKALAVRGDEAGLGKLPSVQRHLTNAADDVVADAFIRLSLAPNLTDAALRPLYQAQFANVAGPEEVRPRVIAVRTLDEASLVIQKLQLGASFGDLAKTLSVDPTAEHGGVVGFVRRGFLSPELDAIAFSLGIGSFTEQPTPVGPYWFVVTVDERRVWHRSVLKRRGPCWSGKRCSPVPEV